MGIFSGIKTLFTGGAVNPDKVTDALINTGDAIWFTSEEKSEASQKRFETWLELQKALANESTPRSVNRRVLAWTVLFMMAVLTLACIAFQGLGRTDMADYTIRLIVELKWGWAFCGVIIFYFGPHMLSTLSGGKK